MTLVKRSIPVAKPDIGEPELEAVRRPVLSGWVTQGPEVEAFEKEFAALVGASHACAVSSCTTALHLALLAAGVGPGDEVITVSHSFIATANSIRYCGAVPIFVDIAPGTFNIDPSRIEAAIGEKTKAILCVHQLGMPCDIEAILGIARRHGIPVVEDAACAAGSEMLVQGEWERIGKPRGDVACFSFHPRKIITTGDGGMLTTSNAEWDKKFRLWRQHGMDLTDKVRHESKGVLFESYETLGFNYRMTDIQAAIGRQQLKRLSGIVQRRRFLAGRYRELLGGIPGLTLPVEPVWARSNWQSFCVGLDARCDRLRVMEYLQNAGVSSRRGVMCTHREPAYVSQPWSCVPGKTRCECPGGSCERLRSSEHAQDHSIILPLFCQMTEEEQDTVARALSAALTSEMAHSK